MFKMIIVLNIAGFKSNYYLYNLENPKNVNLPKIFTK